MISSIFPIMPLSSYYYLLCSNYIVFTNCAVKYKFQPGNVNVRSHGYNKAQPAGRNTSVMAKLITVKLFAKEVLRYHTIIVKPPSSFSMCRNPLVVGVRMAWISVKPSIPAARKRQVKLLAHTQKYGHCRARVNCNTNYNILHLLMNMNINLSRPNRIHENLSQLLFMHVNFQLLPLQPCGETKFKLRWWS